MASGTICKRNYPRQSFANAEAGRDILTLPIVALRRSANNDTLATLNDDGRATPLPGHPIFDPAR
ncbi:hypothetical protein LCGC14_0566510 [marine sediment metagenome]|uniref:Uncharacterized protein n=1 Tax=marine sediment metagenome TaxID=412755 RepID=A0A0F9RQR4_9ZZZZ